MADKAGISCVGQKARVMLLGSFAESLINFRGPLLAAMVTSGFDVHACGPDASPEIQEKLAVLGVHYHNVYLSRAGINPYRDLRTIFSVYQVIRSVQPDLFLAYTIKPVIYGSLAARLARIPQIFSIITGIGYLFATRGVKPWLVGHVARALYRAALRFNQKVFFQNPDDRELFLVMGLVNRDRTALINGSGVDIDHYRKTSLPATPSFLLIARLLNDKGIIEYAEAARMLKKKYPEVVFRLTGWLDENPACIRRTDLQAWTDEGIIDFLGRLEDVRPAIADTAVYVLPSYREGTPRTVLEAMSMGRPIITSDAPGCRETVREGENGFLVPIRDAAALARAMERFIVQPELIESMGRRSCAIAEEKYDVRKVNAVILKEMGLLDEAAS